MVLFKSCWYLLMFWRNKYTFPNIMGMVSFPIRVKPLPRGIVKYGRKGFVSPFSKIVNPDFFIKGILEIT